MKKHNYYSDRVMVAPKLGEILRSWLENNNIFYNWDSHGGTIYLAVACDYEQSKEFNHILDIISTSVK